MISCSLAAERCTPPNLSRKAENQNTSIDHSLSHKSQTDVSAMPLKCTVLSTDREIRLLEVLRRPPQARSRLKLRLHHVSLSSPPQFWAFCYTWGPRESPRTIEIDGHEVSVTPNLYCALWNYVSVLEDWADSPEPTPERLDVWFLWVDALCINQEDFEERARQVRLMSEIYRKGFVAVHLDPGDEKKDLESLSLVKRVALDFMHRITGSEDQRVEEKGKRNDVSYHVQTELWPLLHHFFTKSWFTRIWVIQEYVLADADEYMFWMRKRSLSATELYSVALSIWWCYLVGYSGITEVQKRTMLYGVREYMMIHEVRNAWRMGSRPSGLSCLCLFRDRDATDARDKVYALLGLVEDDGTKRPDPDPLYTELMGSDGTESPKNDSQTRRATQDLDLSKLIVNYGASIEDVFASLVEAMTSETKSLNVICACQRHPEFTRSWVPNWTQPWLRSSFLFDQLYRSMPWWNLGNARFSPYCASKGNEAEIVFSKDKRTMTTKGFEWSKIEYFIFFPEFPLTSHRSFLDWSLSALVGLPEAVRNLILDAYGDGHDKTQVFKPWISATLGGTVDGIPKSSGSRQRSSFLGAQTTSQETHTTLQSNDHPRQEGLDDNLAINARAAQVGERRRIFVCEKGHAGLIPDDAEIGDVLCILYG